MMPDQALFERRPESERIVEVPPDRRPILDAMGPHPYKESEFPEGKGHCDLCGGGPEAKIHNYVDPQERIATALERIASWLESWPDE